MRTIYASLFPLLLLGACATIADAPIVDGGPVQPEGSIVAIGEPVALGELVLTPMRVTQDSRCPINARCVWAGEITVETRIDGAGWRETLPLTLGEAQTVRGHAISLVSAEPGQMAGSDPVRPGEYRFAFEMSASD
ncbi:hypothetical protein [Alteraurantiacibacter aestuarii]|uniref:hypothetical protein n=1 Tax=Alteraurantiacibacter aestuarii TaxID=650004 RepID=UPI0031E1D750